MEHVIAFGDYMPHGMCLLWQPWLLILWAGSDLLIFLSYTAIPIALLRVLRKRDDMPQPMLVALFASFILLCGLTHFFGIVTLWYPIYPLVGVVKLATGIISAITAIVLFRMVPTLIALPSPGALAEANNRLRREIAAHEQTLASLEAQVEQRTAELTRANAMLAVQAREAVHRSGNLLAVVTSLASQTAKGTDRIEDFLDRFFGRIAALANATRSITQESDRASTDIHRVAEAHLAPLKTAYAGRVAFDGPSIAISPEAAQQISLALHELATNTQKYGLGSHDKVTLEVSWTVDKGRFALVWREQGLEPAHGEDSAEKEGFGTKLLTRVIPAVLKGEASRRIDARGLVYRLEAPVEGISVDKEGEESALLAARIIDDSFGLEKE